jgi:hypothetical protein
MRRGGSIFRAADFHSRLEGSGGPDHQLFGRHVPIVSGCSYQRNSSKLIAPRLLAGHPSRTYPWQEPGWMAAYPPTVSLEVRGRDFVTVADSSRHEG